MADDEGQLDMILQTRLDVLDQAVAEVNGVIKAMAEQRERLTEVEAFLAEDGTLYRAENDVLQHIGDAETRLKLLLPPPASRKQVVRSTAAAPSSTLNDPDIKRLREGYRYAGQARVTVQKLEPNRADALRSFQSVRRWSIAGLGDEALNAAVRDYSLMIDEIRKAENPWRRYEAEMPRRGHELFSRYLELLASMAVRGFGLEPAIMADVEALLQQLLEPINLPHKPARRERSPLAMMSSLGRGHLPLGYPEWSLWALPLLGRSVGELVVPSLMSDIDSRQTLICADLYAQHVLGPSYMHAAIFLELDPSAEPLSADVPSDPLRATVLFDNLPRIDRNNDPETRNQIDTVVRSVREQWQRARQAVGGEEEQLTDEDRAVVDRFLNALDRFPEIAYPGDYIADNRDAGRELMTVNGHGDDAAWERSVPAMLLRELMNAMWLARLEDPDKAALIHERAKAVARQNPGPPPSRPVAGARPRR